MTIPPGARCAPVSFREALRAAALLAALALAGCAAAPSDDDGSWRVEGSTTVGGRSANPVGPYLGR